MHNAQAVCLTFQGNFHDQGSLPEDSELNMGGTHPQGTQHSTPKLNNKCISTFISREKKANLRATVLISTLHDVSIQVVHGSLSLDCTVRTTSYCFIITL